MKILSIGVCLFAFSGLGFGQEIDPLGSGKPLVFSLDKLPDDLIALELSTTKDSIRSLFQMSIYNPGMAVPNSESQPAFTQEMLIQLAEVIWVPKGDALSDREYLIGYKMDVGQFPSRSAGGAPPPINYKFRLTYVRRQSINSMTPRDDFSPAKIKEMGQTKVPPSGTSADRTATLSNMKQVGTAIMILLSDNNDQFPYVQSTPQLFAFLMPYAKNEKLFTTKNPMGGTFRFNMGLAGVNASDVPNPALTPMLYESEAWPDGKRGVCFADSHAKFVSAEEWTAMQPLLNQKLKRHGKPIPPGGQLPPWSPPPRSKVN